MELPGGYKLVYGGKLIGRGTFSRVLLQASLSRLYGHLLIKGSPQHSSIYTISSGGSPSDEAAFETALFDATTQLASDDAALQDFKNYQTSLISTDTGFEEQRVMEIMKDNYSMVALTCLLNRFASHSIQTTSCGSAYECRSLQHFRTVATSTL